MDGNTVAPQASWLGNTPVPSNILCEQIVLGTLLNNNRHLSKVAGLKPEHFFDEAHAATFTEILNRISGGEVADGVTMNHWWLTANPDQRGYIASLVANCNWAGEIQSYATELRRLWLRRQVMQVCTAVANQVAEWPNEMLDKRVGQLVSRFSGMVEQASGGAGSVSLSEAAAQAIAQMETASAGMVGIPTGIPGLDRVMGGMEGGHLIVLAGRPGSGKSALGMQIGVNVARDGGAVRAYSLEMSAAQLGRRVLASLSGVPIKAIRAGDVTAEDAGRLIVAQRDLQDLPLHIEDGAGRTMAEISASAMAAHQKRPISLIIIDHLHIVAHGEENSRLQENVALSRTTGAAKRLAKDLNVPVLLLAQLNRGPETRDDHRPTASDLRGSGAIEQDADVIAFVYRAENHMSKTPPEPNPGENEDKHQARVNAYWTQKNKYRGVAELIFAKVRDNEPQAIAGRFDGRTTTFTFEQGQDPI